MGAFFAQFAAEEEKAETERNDEIVEPIRLVENIEEGLFLFVQGFAREESALYLPREIVEIVATFINVGDILNVMTFEVDHELAHKLLQDGKLKHELLAFNICGALFKLIATGSKFRLDHDFHRIIRFHIFNQCFGEIVPMYLKSTLIRVKEQGEMLKIRERDMVFSQSFFEDWRTYKESLKYVGQIKYCPLQKCTMKIRITSHEYLPNAK